jgi:protein-S-isoprenylcysteine O-methyltransferase Ste14
MRLLEGINSGRLIKIFGVGPAGALISFVLLVIFGWAEIRLGHAEILPYPLLARLLGAALVLAGLYLHFWSFFTLRQWWADDGLCTNGPFRYFRHPMYAAWITFIAAGLSLFLNGWLILLWAVLLHPIWHRLVRREEKMMLTHFGETYRAYAARTGRFVPRIATRR